MILKITIGGEMKKIQLLLTLLTTALLFLGCPLRQNQTNGVLNLVSNSENLKLKSGEYLSHIYYTYEEGKGGIIELTIWDSSEKNKEDQVKKVSFKYSGGNVREIQNNGSSIHKVSSLPDLSGKFVADIVLTEKPFQETTESSITTGIKTLITLDLYASQSGLVDAPLGQFKGNTSRIVLETRIRKNGNNDVYAVHSRKPVD